MHLRGSWVRTVSTDIQFMVGKLVATILILSWEMNNKAAFEMKADIFVSACVNSNLKKCHFKLRHFAIR